MSRIGKLPIELEGGVEVRVTDGVVSVRGPKGTLEQALPPGIEAVVEEGRIVVRRKDDSPRQKAFHGLARSLLANAVLGVSKGFQKTLEIHGVGYRAEAQGRTVRFAVGTTHPIDYAVPEGIEVSVQRNLITVSGYDKQQVGQVAAEIRRLRPPDVYKQKGIRYAGEALRKKAGKTGAK